MSRYADMIFRMVNNGDLSVGEARAELASPLCTPDVAAILAPWVMDRAIQGDHWRAGDPELLPCGCVVSYDREQVDTRCDGPRSTCHLDRVLVDADRG